MTATVYVPATGVLALLRFTLQNWMAMVLAAEILHPPMAMLVPGLLVEGWAAVRIRSVVARPVTVNDCSEQVPVATDVGVMEAVSFVMEAVSFSNCIPLD